MTLLLVNIPSIAFAVLAFLSFRSGMKLVGCVFFVLAFCALHFFTAKKRG